MKWKNTLVYEAGRHYVRNAKWVEASYWWTRNKIKNIVLIFDLCSVVAKGLFYDYYYTEVFVLVHWHFVGRVCHVRFFCHGDGQRARGPINVRACGGRQQGATHSYRMTLRQSWYEPSIIRKYQKKREKPWITIIRMKNNAIWDYCPCCFVVGEQTTKNNNTEKIQTQTTHLHCCFCDERHTNATHGNAIQQLWLRGKARKGNRSSL